MRHKFMLLTLLLCAGCNYGGLPADDEPTPDADVPASIERMQVAQVIDYSPAPGQYVNLLPPFADGDDASAMAAKALDYLNRGYALTLGAFGGSITLRLEEPLKRNPGHPEFFIAGNAISNGSEPAIVEVSADGSGWYPLKGEIPLSRIVTTAVMYSRIEGSDDIPFTAVAEGEVLTGTIPWQPQYRAQCYWPEWVEASELSFEAPRLPSNSQLDPLTDQYQFTPYYGYADSYPNSSPLGYLSLDDAVDPSTGQPVELSEVSYLRVTTSILAVNGPLGEVSSEISGVYRLTY